MIFIVISIWYTFRIEIINLYTDIESTKREALKATWLFVFNIFPDLYKGMLKGTIKSLGIQYKSVFVHLLCHWFIYPLSAYIFVFGPYCQYGIEGIWMSKITLEWSTVTCYLYIIGTSNWDQIA